MCLPIQLVHSKVLRWPGAGSRYIRGFGQERKPWLSTDCGEQRRKRTRNEEERAHAAPTDTSIISAKGVFTKGQATVR